MNLYASLFEDSEVLDVKYYGAEQKELAGRVLQIRFRLSYQTFRCTIPPAPHEFDFTPSFSIFNACDNEAQQISLFQTLAANGKIMISLDNYASVQDSPRSDRFSVSWQLNLLWFAMLKPS